LGDTELAVSLARLARSCDHREAAGEPDQPTARGCE
jgi:hypothetical protein